MKHILMPCDFSPEAEQAFIFAVSIARETGAAITTLHVIDMPFIVDPVTATPFFGDSQLIQSAKQSAEEKFKSYCHRHAQDLHNIRFVVEEGPVTTVINNFAQRKDIDFVVMGTKGATGLKELLIGSNTEKIVRSSSVPVLAVRKAVPFKGIETIVFPTSLALNQDDFIHELKKLQTLFNAHLHLLYVNTPHCFMNDDDINEYIAFYQLSDVSFSMKKSPTEAYGILDYVQETNPDLLVMATNGRKGLAHLFAGSISEHIVNHVTCPVWTYVLKKSDDDDTIEKEVTAMSRRVQRHLEED